MTKTLRKWVGLTIAYSGAGLLALSIVVFSWITGVGVWLAEDTETPEEVAE